MPQDSKAWSDRSRRRGCQRQATQDELETLHKQCAEKTHRQDVEGNKWAPSQSTKDMSRRTSRSLADGRPEVKDLSRSGSLSNQRAAGSTSNIVEDSPCHNVSWSELVGGNKEAKVQDTQYIRPINNKIEPVSIGHSSDQNSGNNHRVGSQEESTGPDMNWKNSRRVSLTEFSRVGQDCLSRSHNSFDLNSHDHQLARVSDPIQAERDKPRLEHPGSTSQEIPRRHSDTRWRWSASSNEGSYADVSKDCSNLNWFGPRSKAGSKFKNLVRDYKIKLPNLGSLCDRPLYTTTETLKEPIQTATGECSGEFTQDVFRAEKGTKSLDNAVNAASEITTLGHHDISQDQNLTSAFGEGSINSSPQPTSGSSSEECPQLTTKSPTILRETTPRAPYFEASHVAFVQSELGNLSLEEGLGGIPVYNEAVDKLLDDGDSVNLSKRDLPQGEQRMPVPEASEPSDSQTSCHKESNKASKQAGAKDVTFASSINAEIQEEMARAESMSLPVSFRPKSCATGVSSNLNPSAHEFSPALTDGNGNWFSMCSRKGVYYFRPQARPLTSVKTRSKESAALENCNTQLEKSRPEFRISTLNTFDECGSQAVTPSDGALVSSGLVSDVSNDVHPSGTYTSPVLDSGQFSNHLAVTQGVLAPVPSHLYPENFSSTQRPTFGADGFPNAISMAPYSVNYQPMSQDGQLTYAFSTFQDPALWASGLPAGASEVNYLPVGLPGPDQLTTTVHPGAQTDAAVQQLGCVVSVPDSCMPYLPPVPASIGVSPYSSMQPTPYESMFNLQGTNLSLQGMPMSHYMEMQSSAEPLQPTGVSQLPSGAMANPAMICMGPPPPYFPGASPNFNMFPPPICSSTMPFVGQASAHGGVCPPPPSNLAQQLPPAGPIFHPNAPLAVPNYAPLLPHQTSSVDSYTSTAQSSVHADPHRLRTCNDQSNSAQNPAQYGVKHRQASSDPANFASRTRRYSMNRYSNNTSSRYPQSMGGSFPAVGSTAGNQDSTFRREDPALKAVMRVTADKLIQFMRTSSADRLWTLRDSLTDQDKSDISTVQTLLGFMSSLQSSVPNMSDNDFKELLVMNLEALQPFMSLQDTAVSKYTFSPTNEIVDKPDSFKGTNQNIANIDGEINEKSWLIKETNHKRNESDRSLGSGHYSDTPVSCQQGRTFSKITDCSKPQCSSAPRTDSQSQSGLQISTVGSRRPSHGYYRGNKDRGKGHHTSFTNSHRPWRHDISSSDRPLRRNM